MRSMRKWFYKKVILYIKGVFVHIKLILIIIIKALLQLC